jgi:hypothetical protein
MSRLYLAVKRCGRRDVLLAFIGKALKLGAPEIDCKDGEERICAMLGTVGVGIGSLPSNSGNCRRLYAKIAALRKARRIDVGDVTYRTSVRAYDSFGSTAYRIVLMTRRPGAVSLSGRRQKR